MDLCTLFSTGAAEARQTGEVRCQKSRTVEQIARPHLTGTLASTQPR